MPVRRQIPLPLLEGGSVKNLSRLSISRWQLIGFKQRLRFSGPAPLAGAVYRYSVVRYLVPAMCFKCAVATIGAACPRENAPTTRLRPQNSRINERHQIVGFGFVEGFTVKAKSGPNAFELSVAGTHSTPRLRFRLKVINCVWRRLA